MGETAADDSEEYWYNIKTNRVETGKQSAAIYRIGPFSSFKEAALALETIRKRSQKWQDDERNEN